MREIIMLVLSVLTIILSVLTIMAEKKRRPKQRVVAGMCIASSLLLITVIFMKFI